MEDKINSLKDKALALGATQYEVDSVTGATAKAGVPEYELERLGKQWETEDKINAAGKGLTEEEMSYQPLADDYVPLDNMFPEAEQPKISHRKSVKSAAATSALLAGNMEQAVQDFENIVAMELEGAGSEALASANGLSSAASLEAKKEVATGVLLSKATDDEKVNALNNLASEDSNLSDPHYLLAKKAIETPSDTDLTDEEADQRISMIDGLDWANEQRYKKHEMYNAAVAKLDPNYGNALWDMATTAILPFVEPFVVDSVYEEFKKTIDEKDRDGFNSWLAGNQKVDLRDAIAKATPDQRLVLAEKLVAAIENHATTPLTGMNDPAKLQLLEEFIGGGGYDTSDQAIDNLFEILDYTILGGIAARFMRSTGRVIKGSLEAATAVDQYRDYVRYAVRGDTDPTSPARVAGAHNPQLARELHAATMADETDATAEALYGSTRDDALVDDVMAQPDTLDGTVKYRVGEVDLDVSANVLDAARSGELERAPGEKVVMNYNYREAHKNVEGLELKREMTQVGESKFEMNREPDGIRVKATYGPTGGVWDSAERAMEEARWRLRDLGVRDEDIRLLQRRGDEYVEVSVKDAKAWETLKDAMDNAGVRKKEVDSFSKDYIVQIDNHYKYKDSDSPFANYDVANNIFDRIGAWAGTKVPMAGTIASRIQTMALDPASVIDKRYFKAAVASVARAANIEKEILAVGKKFGDGFLKLPRNRQMVIEDIIKEANFKGKHYSEVEAAAQGLSRQEKDILDSWKAMWDTMYVLENADAVRSLRNQGYREFVSTTSDTKLFAKPVPRNQVTLPIVYDADKGKAVPMDAAQLDKLYAEGGTLGRVRGGVRGVDGLESQYVLVKNKPDSFMRELNDSTAAINYREGYYSVKYKDQWFIDKEIVRADGTSYKKAVASFGTKREADMYYEKMNRKEGSEVVNPDGSREIVSPYFQPRGDNKGGELDVDSWDLAVHSGRSAQRLRGERLAGVEDGVVEAGKADVYGPIESMVSSARSIANRTSVRRVIETGKARLAAQYGKYLPVDPITGRPQWPSSIDQIRERGTKKTSLNEVGDARTMYAYIDYLENGYVNTMDNVYKMVVNGMANFFGSKSVTAGKLFSYLQDTRGPSGFGKSVAFNAYLVANPIRQALIQSHQAIQLSANFPKAIVKDIPTQMPLFFVKMVGGNLKDHPALLKAAGLTAEEGEEMYRAFKQSGLVAQIDKQNLVREGLSHIVDQTGGALTSTGKVARAGGATLDFMRKIGFDAGETVNMMTSFIAHYNKAKREGLQIKRQDRIDEIVAESINYTYNMNAAGDMRYNSNSLALLMQFMQVPHKALLQMTTNRHLTKAEKGRLALWNTVMYGIPTSIAIKLGSDAFPDNPEAAHALTFGLESALLNRALNDDPDTETDFSSSLAATGAYGFFESLRALLFDRSLSEAIANTPSGKLFFGSDPRIADAFRSLSRAIGWSEDFDSNPTTAVMAIKEFVEIGSGFSNIFQGLYMDSVKRTKSGLDLTVSDEDTWRKALFGFSTADESRARALREEYFKESKQLKEDVKEYYRLMKAHLGKQEIDPQSAEFVAQVYNNTWRVWKESSIASEFVMKELQTLMSRDVERYDVKLVDMLFKMPTKDDVLNMVHSLPESNTYKKEEIVEMFKSIYGDK